MVDTGTWVPQARRGRRRFLLLILAVVVVTGVAGFALAASGVLDGVSHVIRGEPPAWAEIVGLVICVLGLAAAIAAFWYLVRSGIYRRNARSRLWAESWSRRRRLVRQVRGTAPYQPEELPLLQRTARQLIDQPKLLLPLAALGVLQTGQAFLQWSPYFAAVAGFLLVGLMVAGLAARRDVRRARAFLAEHE
ncbi:hypothetical protein [Micromonospora sp. NPDC126480]|uniref:hypothetical protein n=1 Tax=Micromonospora sp. NPDC126480 TaxID=3155312 RepID=UPI003326307F